MNKIFNIGSTILSYFLNGAILTPAMYLIGSAISSSWRWIDAFAVGFALAYSIPFITTIVFVQHNKLIINAMSEVLNLGKGK